MALLTATLYLGGAMEGSTQDLMDGDLIHGNNVARSWTSPPEVGSNMADHGLAEDISPANHMPRDHALEGSIPGDYDPVGNSRAREHSAPLHQAAGHQSLWGHICHDHTVGQDPPDLYIGVGDGNDQGKPGTFMRVDDVGGQYTDGDSRLRTITFHGKLTLLSPPSKLSM